MKRFVGLIGAALLAIAASVGAPAAFAGPGQGEGNTPTLVCHWVPAHDGSFVVIVVDDDGANGNKNLQAHAQHENDVIAPADGACPDGGEED